MNTLKKFLEERKLELWHRKDENNDVWEKEKKKENWKGNGGVRN